MLSNSLTLEACLQQALDIHTTVVGSEGGAGAA